MAKPANSWQELPDLDLGSSKHPVLITGANRSLMEEQHARVVKYTLLMSVRIPCLFLAGWAYMQWEAAWISIAIIAISVPLPWMAVLIANDGPPKQRRKKRRGYEPVSDAPALPIGQPTGEHTTVDG